MSSEDSTTIANRSQRLTILTVLMLLLWGGITVRLTTIHLRDGLSMQNRVQQQQTSQETIAARPGDILDRNGRLLATSVATSSLYAVPNQIEDLELFAEQIAPTLNQDPTNILKILNDHQGKGFCWLARRITPETADAVHQLDLSPGSFGFESEFKRFYPNGKSAAHLLGFRNIDGLGRGGVEQKYDDILKGLPGKRTFIRDARNRVIHVFEDQEQPVKHGKTIHLTLDLRNQTILENTLDQIMQHWAPAGCCALLCNPQTGDLLASGSRPTYDPSDPRTFATDAWMNRAVAWSYEPGSTMKPLIVSWALQKNLVTPVSHFHGHWGAYKMGTRILHDSHPLGDMLLGEVLAKSSNIGMAQIGERLQNRGLYEALQQFGFGYPSGLGLPGEISGTVRSLSEWDDYSTGSIPMGQELAVTPLQMLMAHATLANRGRFQQPQLLLKVEDADTYEKAPQLSMPLINPQHASWILRKPLRQVMAEGTGRHLETWGLDVYGKTGTSQVYDPEIGAYSDTKTVCSFVGGVPAADPRLLVIVVVDQPTRGESHFGSTVAGPAAMQILKQSWDLLPLHYAGQQPEGMVR